ncbi:MAG: hypothetical protein WAW96_04780 [Alphaproteobacteria bacterium]
MEKFDYGAPAELFARKHATKPKQIDYVRFARASDAIQHAVESVPAKLLLGTWLLVGGHRYSGKAIRALYDDAAYPLYRRSEKNVARSGSQ